MAEGKWMAVARVADIPSNTPLAVDLGVWTIALYRVGDKVYATDDVCSHAGASLSDGGHYEGFVVTCPAHGGQFDIRTGQAVRMPAISPIATFAVQVQNGTVLVQLPDP
jgi:nitrite reductase/ring-hydroxylating ferredoxin subunit